MPPVSKSFCLLWIRNHFLLISLTLSYLLTIQYCLIGNKLVLNGEGKHEVSHFKDSVASVTVTKRDPEKAELIITETDSCKGNKIIHVDGATKQRNRSNSDSKSRTHNHEQLTNKIDSNGNIIKEACASDSKSQIKKKSGKSSKQRSKSFHIKCDRTYTNYYKIEYKGDGNGSKQVKCNKSKDDCDKPDNHKPSHAVNFDCSEEYFVDDEDDRQLNPDFSNNLAIADNKKRASSLEPCDYNSSFNPSPAHQVSGSKDGVQDNSYVELNRMERNSRVNMAETSQNCPINNGIYAAPYQPAQMYRPSIQR